jgi:hypothetical protein
MAVLRLAAGLLVLLSACETVRRGTTHTLSVVSNPAGAACSVSLAGVLVGTVAATPGQVTFDKSFGRLDVRCDLPGYQTALRLIDASIAPSAGGLFPAADLIDAASGANNRFPNDVTLVLTPVGERPALIPLSGTRLR